MAENISLVLTGATQGVIQGVHSQSSLDRVNTIEVFALKNAIGTSFDRSTLQSTRRHYYEPVTFTKGVDASTVKIRQALVRSERITSARFRWFRSSPAGSGTMEHFLTLLLQDARITSCVLRLPDAMDPVAHTQPPLDEVSIVFDRVTWTFHDGGIEFEDTWQSQT